MVDGTVPSAGDVNFVDSITSSVLRGYAGRKGCPKTYQQALRSVARVQNKVLKGLQDLGLKQAAKEMGDQFLESAKYIRKQVDSQDLALDVGLNVLFGSMPVTGGMWAQMLASELAEEVLEKRLRREVSLTDTVTEEIKNMIGTLAAQLALLPLPIKVTTEEQSQYEKLVRRFSVLGMSLGFLFSAAYLSDTADMVADSNLLFIIASVGLKLTILVLKSAFKDKMLQTFSSIRREFVLLTLSRRSL